MNVTRSRTIPVVHITIISDRTFAEVRSRLESAVPLLDDAIVSALSSGDEDRVRDYDVSGPKLSIFLSRDHGALLNIVGRPSEAVQYEIGNPSTATKMTRYQIGAALYAPLRILLYADEQGRGVFEYDQPSSFFDQFGDDRATEVGRYLDNTLETTLRAAAA